MKSHMGYDPTKWDFAEKLSEFDCDFPIIECSTENILREVREKGEKHKSGNTDLFIFVLEDEFRVMMDLLHSGPRLLRCFFQSDSAFALSCCVCLCMELGDSDIRD